jgi:DNA-binding transcriptional ArsR family regulator
MLVLRLDMEDLAATRFAISPMGDVVASLQRRNSRGRHPATGPWEATIDARLAGMDTELLDALTTSDNWLPDFLSPFPEQPRSSLAHELATVRALPAQRVREDVLAAYRHGPLPHVLRRGLRDPTALAAAIADLVQRYWDAALSDVWPRILAVLEADIAYRSQQLVSDGLTALFADLSPEVTWTGRELHVDVAPQLDLEVDVAGRRLALVPLIFARRPLINISATLPPVLAYPARGAATVWDDTAPAPGELAALLGRGRADVLAALDVPRATVDLARALGVTPGAVSQHLRILAACDLVAGARQGRRVLYRRTELGDRLAGVGTSRGPTGAAATVPA